MMRRLERIFIGCLMVLLAACQQQEVIEKTEDAVELTFKIALSDNGSRGLEDGDCLNLVSVYLIDADNGITRQENILVANNATEVEVTFDKSYNLKRGIYTLMAVANHGTLNSFKNTDDYDALMNKQVHATSGTDNISPKNIIQPLSLMKEIELHAGNNEIEGELVRTFARVRIEVKNNSGSMPLKINSLTFSDNFTQQQAYVFDDGTDRKYSFETGAPVSTSTYALQPFTKDDGQTYKTIAAQTSGVVFDSYLLESQSDEGYTYTLDLEYEGVTTTTTTYSRTGNAISQVKNLEVNEESYYLIYNTNSGRYLSAGDDVVETASLSEFTNLGTHVVWQVAKNGNSYIIKNVETGEYLQAPGNGSVALGSTQVSYTLEQMESWNNNYIGLINNNYYVGVYTDEDRWGNTYNVQGYNRNSWSSARYFYFYKVFKTTTTSQDQDITYNTPITLTTIDPTTQQATLATAIKRNDFINILVTVSYNPVAGKLEFQVEDWKTGGGQVEFN